jgi:hypothetical protein
MVGALLPGRILAALLDIPALGAAAFVAVNLLKRALKEHLPLPVGMSAQQLPTGATYWPDAHMPTT